MKILIAGGGIGGLTAALCLSQAGHDVTVLERNTSFADVGAGIQCGANAIKVLDSLGLLPDLESVAVQPERVEFRDGVSGDVLYRTEFGQLYQARYGAPYLHIHRADLHDILLAALVKRDSGMVMRGASVETVAEDAAGVTVTLRDQSTVRGDCLIGADGIHSIVRQSLFGESSPRFTGNVAWRGVVPVERLPHDFMPTQAINFMGARKHMVVYYVRSKQLLNFVGVVESASWNNESWTETAPWQELKRDFAGWHPMVQQVVEAVDRDACFKWALHDHAPLTSWSSARISLLGDAAHATLPFMASGAAMAIEDARVLQRALDKHDTPMPGLAMYQRNRLSRTAKIQRDSARFGTLYHLEHRWLLKQAFNVLSVVGRKKERFLAGYDANAVELK
ncbi:FAD-dependent monooxygenase [Arenicella xantha]|uniref:Salicylate hydroxylase n=1 Tax=Arenicella xantha TaxID=644221 RepID=A0A395JLI1_9GAMM|nr:FAD-dependent monooxygenase [Arenicella xantha]RBP51653.1 salicylate hydroxylase [Arenicella xantha]